MNRKITVLPDDVANHIAAGEVIERPASVVKELVENSIDAGSTQIDIEIGVGGKAYMRIHDNGHGMSREDAQLAFERHATSKIISTKDISSIATMGFRGEALPSIASVSRLTLLTQTADSHIGTRIEIHGGDMRHVVESAATTGTYIEVNDLFYKTPARLKFLKAPATELSYINNVITDLALANAPVGFSVKNNAKEQLHLSENHTLQQRISGIFGRDIVRELIELRESAASMELTGFVGLPSLNKANRTYQKVFINRRPVKDKVISHAIQQAYDTLMPKRRHPVVFLYLSLPLELVDVNVHPTKMEVRFVNSQVIHQFIVKAIRQALSSALHVQPASSFAPQVVPEISDAPVFEPPAARQSDGAWNPEKYESQRTVAKSSAPRSFLPQSRMDFPAPSDEPFSEKTRFETRRQRLSAPASLPSQGGDMVSSFLPGSAMFSRMKPIGQFQETYILAEEGDDLFVIDQHAAHERIFYEKFKAQLQAESIDVQPLLFPVSIDLSPREQAVLDEHLDTLNRYGLELEYFGGSTYLLKALPALLAKADYKKLLYDVIDQLLESGKSDEIERKLDEVIIVMSCHSAIRAHHRLQEAQMIALLKQLDELELPYTCPHGRPTILKISLADLEKKFKRT